jgi:hypothetical protein
MEAAAQAAAHEAFRLARAGRVDEALPFAERAVDGAQECLPAHGFLASLLLKLGRPHEAERSGSSCRRWSWHPVALMRTTGLLISRWLSASTIERTPFISARPNLRRTILGFGTTWRVVTAASAS